MRRQKSPRWHTIYSIVTTLIEEAAIAAILLWVLPLFGIHIPLWGILLIMIGFGIFSYVSYLIGHPTISYKEVNAPESIVGREGIVESELNPDGYVRVAGELWKANAGGLNIAKGTSVIVTGIKGLKLTVRIK